METVMLYRPVGPGEFKLIEESGFHRFPPRLPEQPIFHPVTNEKYGVEIAERWNVKESGSGFVIRFEVRADFLGRYEPHVVGARHHEEYWIPAEELDAFNDAIVGSMEVLRSFGACVTGFNITPHVGIGPVRLLDSRGDVRAALAGIGIPLLNSRGSLDYFSENALQVEYGADERADFIGIASTPTLQASYFGTNVFDTPAEAVFLAIARSESAEVPTFEAAEFLFREQIITLWNADSQYDWRKLGRLIWGQVGVGSRRYLDGIDEARNR